MLDILYSSQTQIIWNFTQLQHWMHNFKYLKMTFSETTVDGSTDQRHMLSFLLPWAELFYKHKIKIKKPNLPTQRWKLLCGNCLVTDCRRHRKTKKCVNVVDVRPKTNPTEQTVASGTEMFCISFGSCGSDRQLWTWLCWPTVIWIQFGPDRRGLKPESVLLVFKWLRDQLIVQLHGALGTQLLPVDSSV